VGHDPALQDLVADGDSAGDQGEGDHSRQTPAARKVNTAARFFGWMRVDMVQLPGLRVFRQA
jgi:hypothetical protein